MGLISRKSIIETIARDRVRFFFEMLGVHGRDPVFQKYLSRCYLPPRIFERVQGEGFGVPRGSVYQHIDEKCVDLPEQ